MSSPEDPMAQSLPRTFTEVIERGFPGERRKNTSHMHESRPVGERTTAAAPEAPSVPRDSIAIRKDQAALSVEEQQTFKKALTQLVTDGSYLSLIRHHQDMRHNMHGSMGVIGLYRFLGWHRRYLLEMERQLQRADASLSPSATSSIAIPYWRWQDPFPEWLQGFLPANDPSTGLQVPARKTAFPPEKPDIQDLDTILNQSSIQHTGITGENEYTRFTWGIEGWGRRPDGSALPAHNHGHAWIGGIMNDTSKSPTDPMFWLHHAEVDRIWQAWRQLNPHPQPLLTGADRVMDPWAESYEALLVPEALGYAYDSLSI